MRLIEKKDQPKPLEERIELAREDCARADADSSFGNGLFLVLLLIGTGFCLAATPALLMDRVVSFIVFGSLSFLFIVGGVLALAFFDGGSKRTTTKLNDLLAVEAAEKKAL